MLVGCYWLFFLESFLQSFVARQFDVRLYKSTVNLSIIGDKSSIRDKVAWSPRLLKIWAISSNQSLCNSGQKRHLVASSECMEKWESAGSWFTKIIENDVDRNILSMFPNSEIYPKFFQLIFQACKHWNC